MSYKVIGAVNSRTFRVLWMLQELGQSYEHASVPPHAPDVLTHNSSGKIPVLLDGETALSDSVAIITYLADKHQGLTYPAGTLERARQDGLTQMILDEMDAALWTAARHSFILPEEHRLPEIKPSVKMDFATAEARIAARLDDGPFLMGEMITVPDIVLGHCLGWAIVAKFGISEPRLSAYLDRLKDRPAYQAARS